MRPEPGEPRRTTLRLAAVLAGGLGILAMAGCQKPAAQAAPPPAVVGVVAAKRMTVPLLSTTNATTRALQDVVVRARVRGFLNEVNFQEGSFVKQGDLLFVIDEEPYRVALQSARAKRSDAEAAVRKADQSRVREVAAAQLALDEAQLSLSLIEERRVRSLLTRNAGSREDVDRAEAARKKNQAQVDADNASLEQSKADYEVGNLSAKAQLEAALAAVRDAEINLGYCRMYAPIEGRIGEAKVKVGNLVGSDMGGGAFSELATIQQLDPMGVDIRVSSRFLERATRLIKQGLPATLTRPGLEGEVAHPESGECYFIDNMIDSTTSTFLVKARVPNPRNTLLPGEYVNMTVEVDRIEAAVVVPEAAVMETEAGPLVYLVDGEGKVAIQRVEAAQAYQGMRVVLEGLKEGTPVILQGLQIVRPGMPVKTEPAVVARSTGEGSKGGTAAPASGNAPTTTGGGPSPANAASPGNPAASGNAAGPGNGPAPAPASTPSNAAAPVSGASPAESSTSVVPSASGNGSTPSAGAAPVQPGGPRSPVEASKATTPASAPAPGGSAPRP